MFDQIKGGIKIGELLVLSSGIAANIKKLETVGQETEEYSTMIRTEKALHEISKSVAFGMHENAAAMAKAELAKNSVKVVFEKADKSIRTMICTTNPDAILQVAPSDETANLLKSPSNADRLLASVEQLKEKRKVKENPFQIRVFDIEKKAWRSFNIKSLKEITLLQG